MKYNIHQLPSPGFLTYQLTKEEMDFVWTRIAKASDESKNPKLYNDRLAGNISKSYDMGIYDLDIINNIIFRLAHEYERQFSSTVKPYEDQVAGEAVYHLALRDWWVNYQYQNEFNPMHDHSGTYSFVIWLKIPTNFKEQSNKSIAKNSSNPDAISNFSLTYTDVFGKIRELLFGMDKNREGQILFFPAQINHSVYPFYDEDDARVSVSGNIGLVEA